MSNPNNCWLRRMADAEDAAGSVSVGGMAADMGMVSSECSANELFAARLEAEYYREVVEKIGEMLGRRSRISDYGVDTGMALPVRIYELIGELLQQSKANGEG